MQETNLTPKSVIFLNLHDTHFALLPSETNSKKSYAQFEGLRRVKHTGHQQEGNEKIADLLSGVNQ